MRPSAFVALAVLASVSPDARPQDTGAALERIEVTGSRLDYSDLLDTPAVAITRRGDYLVQQVRLINDSRDAELRRNELHQTIAGMLSAAKGQYQLLHGDSYRQRLTPDDHRPEPEKDAKRPDTESILLHVRTELGGGAEAAETAIRRLRAFAAGSRAVGRTDIELVGETALGMSRPERYRYELIEAIAEDSRRILQAMRLECRIELEGLGSRIEWERVSPADLMLFLPYRMTVVDCRAAAAN